MPNKKGTNASPSRANYWASGRLEKHKVRNLVRFNKLAPDAARTFWRSVRTTRILKPKKATA